MSWASKDQNLDRESGRVSSDSDSESQSLTDCRKFCQILPTCNANYALLAAAARVAGPRATVTVAAACETRHHCSVSVTAAAGHGRCRALPQGSTAGVLDGGLYKQAK